MSRDRATDRAAGAGDQRMADAMQQERSRPLNFIRRRIPDRHEAEDIAQDVFYELLLAYRLMKPEERDRFRTGVARHCRTDVDGSATKPEP